MSGPLVTLVNPGLVHRPITPYTLTTSLEDAGFDAEVLDLTPARDRWQGLVRDYFRRARPVLVGITIRNTNTIHPQEQRVFLNSHKDVIEAVQHHTGAPIVAGFSSMPFALVDYFDIDFGVVGPGEMTLVRLAEALLAARSLATVSGLIINSGNGVVRQVP